MLRAPGMSRVVVTGMGLVTPLGCGKVDVWERLMQGHCGVNSIEPFHEDIPIRVAARVKDFDVDDIFGKQSSRYRSRSTHYALHASDLALEDAGLNQNSDIDRTRVGVAVASGMGSLQEICDGNETYKRSHRKLSPFFVSKILISSTSGEISIRNHFMGPNHAVTTACAAGAHAIGDAYNFIRLGYADIMVSGGTEACLDSLSIAGFAKMRALTRSSDPLTASSPFDVERKGFVIGEGSGILILESLESAQKRNADIIAEIVGYGLSGDGHHITSPPEDGHGAYRAMDVALRDAGLSANDIGYINAHATSTPTGDLAEINAIQSLFTIPQAVSTKDLFLSSTKGATGHLLGAAGAVEAAFTCLALQKASLPPTLNLKNPVSSTLFSSTESNIRRICHVTSALQSSGENGEINYAISNSFGFGGTNASLIFKKWNT